MKYRVEDLIAQGGTSELFKAWDTVLDRPVALKVLQTINPASKERLIREARGQGRIDPQRLAAAAPTGAGDADSQGSKHRTGSM